ncbi:EAL domain-containing protein [Christensenella timonensis]|uniref:EAL domain-containing protein n=1 Tax=Christensenella timonensis TaxID=1816678 RepID=UPI00082C0725|nr:EAL domain-containing protein [Christensenella timonensis]
MREANELEYIKQLNGNLGMLEAYVCDQKPLDAVIEHFMAFVKGYISLRGMALLRFNRQGQVKEYAACRDGKVFVSKDHREFPVFQIPDWPGLLGSEEGIERFKRESAVVLGEAVEDFLAVKPVFADGFLMGVIIAEKAGLWTKKDNDILGSLAFTVRIAFSNKEKNESQAEQTWVFNQLMDNVRMGVLITDPQTDRILFANNVIRETYGLEEPEGEICWKVLQEGKKERCEFCPIPQLETSKQPNPSCVWEDDSSAAGKVFECCDSLVPWMDGRIVHLQQSTDITNSKKLKRAASIDELTGIRNRRAGKEVMKAAIEQARRQNETITVCLYDINFLKLVNDTYGHTEGDKLLVRISKAVEDALDPENFSFRMSGDEFVVLFRHCNERAADRVMRRILEQLALTVKREQLPYELSFCYGLVELPPSDQRQIPEIVADADEIMYQKKRAYHTGRIKKADIDSFAYDKEHLYEALTDSTNDYIYLCNMQTNLFRFPPAMVEEFGLPGEVIYDTVPVWGALIHKDQREAFFQNMQDLADGLTDIHDLVYRVKNRNGQWVWVHCRGKVTRDESGNAQLFAGIITKLHSDEIPKEMGDGEAALRGKGETLNPAYEYLLNGSYTEIYEGDLINDTLNLILQNKDILKILDSSGSYRNDNADYTKKAVHPDDAFLHDRLYDAAVLTSRFDAGEKEVIGEYRRLGTDGEYHWIIATILPAGIWDRDNHKVLVLIKDITKSRRQQEERKKQENRAYSLFRQSCDMVAEIDLVTEECAYIVYKGKDMGNDPPKGSYKTMLEAHLGHIGEEAEKERIKSLLAVDSLRRMAHGDRRFKTVQLCIKDQKEQTKWYELSVFVEEGEHPVAVLAERDITQQKEDEHKKNIVEQYDSALRNIYDELYEMNVTKNTYKAVYHTPGKYVIPAEGGVLTEGVAEVAGNMIHPEDRERFLQFFELEKVRREFSSGAESRIGEFRKLLQNGEYRWASLTVLPVKRSQGDDEIFLCFIMDIDEKKRSDDVLEQNKELRKQQLADERYRIVLEQTGTIVFEWNTKTKERYIPCKLAETLAGDYGDLKSRDVLLAWLEDGVVHPGDVPALEKFIQEIRKGSPYLEVVLRLKSKAGEYRWYKVAQTHILDEQGNVERVLGTLNDVDEVTKSQEALKYRAEFDMLTGIYNIQEFYARTRKLLHANADKKYAVIRMDIHRFKYINDLYGMEEGDKLLQFIAAMLREKMGVQDAYGRLGGDIFCMCVAYEDRREIRELSEELSRALESYKLGYRIIPYFGICIVDDRDTPVSILCDWAQLALKTVKGSTLSHIAFYDDKLRARQIDERKIEDEMEAALEKGQFVVYLQPKHDIRTSRIVGAEALARWNHPKEGMIGPERFIPLFETNGFVIRLDEYIWEETFKSMRAWLDKGYREVPVSVNVSRLHIFNRNFKEKIIALTEKYGIPKRMVELELTESTFIENPDELYEKMNKLRQAGFRFSMDDFGSGYSSLNMLKNAMVNTIKLDREFLNETVATAKGKTVIRYTVAMANTLDLHVIPEGVETKEQADFLMGVGCEIAQGFYFSRPMPVSEFEKLLMAEG